MNDPNNWISCFCVVHFDTELGQVLECVVPSSATFTTEEQTSICFLAFPDSNCHGNGGASPTHSFRLLTGHGPLYGSVYFSQTKDESVNRGYLQRSICLLSTHPFSTLFSVIVERVGKEFIDGGGVNCLETAYKRSIQWQKPVGIGLRQLWLGTQDLGVSSEGVADDCVVRILGAPPTSYDLSELGTKGLITSQMFKKDPNVVVLDCSPYFLDVDLCLVFHDMLAELWNIWELVLTGAPIMVMGNTPNQCSEVVLGLISLIAPLEYGGDYRPYFSVHDQDFRAYSSNPTSNERVGRSSSRKQHQNVILGVTNPFFLKACGHWPHIIGVGQDVRPSGHEGSGSTILCENGLISKVKNWLMTQSKSVMDQIESTHPTTTNFILRSHFLALTERFILPLERHIASLMPLAKDVSPFKAIPPLKPFNTTECLKSIKRNDDVTDLSRLHCSKSKSDWMGLYKRFMESSSFRHWLHGRQEEAEAALHSIWGAMVVHYDVVAGMDAQIDEIHRVDLYLRIKGVMEVECSRPDCDERVLESLKTHVATALSCIAAKTAE